MQKLTTKIISFILTLSFIFSASVPAFAMAPKLNPPPSAENIILAREIYNQLNDDVKNLFHQVLARNIELQQFHKKYIDPEYPVSQGSLPNTKNVIFVNCRSLLRYVLPITLPMTTVAATANPFHPPITHLSCRPRTLPPLTDVAAAAAAPLVVLEAELVKIGLPEAIKYVLMALGSAIAAEGVEKSLTANAIKALFPSISIFTIFADHWKMVGH